MRDRVDERIVLFVTADRSHEEDGVQDQPCNNDGKKNNAEDKQNHLAEVEQYPTDIERHGQPDEQYAEDKKENCRFTSTHAFNVKVKT